MIEYNKRHLPHVSSVPHPNRNILVWLCFSGDGVLKLDPSTYNGKFEKRCYEEATSDACRNRCPLNYLESECAELIYGSSHWFDIVWLIAGLTVTSVVAFPSLCRTYYLHHWVICDLKGTTEDLEAKLLKANDDTPSEPQP